MGKGNFSDDFKRDAVAQITERGYPVAEVSRRLGVSPHSLYAWKKTFAKVSEAGGAGLTPPAKALRSGACSESWRASPRSATF